MQIRKDFALSRAHEVADRHAMVFASDKIVRWMDNNEEESDVSAAEDDLAFLQGDKVGEAVIDYGQLGSKIESLSQLSTMQTVRSDVAMISLARAYVSNCVRRGGSWTSGLHLYWWAKTRLAEVPNVEVSDLRLTGVSQLARQAELTSWSVMMFRLSLVDDIVEYAGEANDKIGRVGSLLDQTATAVPTFNVAKLSKRIQKEVIPLLDDHLDKKRYIEMAQQLHQER